MVNFTLGLTLNSCSALEKDIITLPLKLKTTNYGLMLNAGTVEEQTPQHH